MNAQRPSNRFDSRMIRKPHRQPRFQRTAWGFVTLAFWGFYFYLWAPLVTLFSWLIGGQLAWQQLYERQSQFDPYVLVALPLMLLCASAWLGGAGTMALLALTGFAVGIAEKSQLISGETIAEGDVVLGLASSGAHSNGYSLLRKILERDAPDLNADFHGRTLRETVLEPTRIYVKPLLALMKEAPGLVKGMAHITGGGLLDNVPRVLPAGLSAHIDASSWTLPPLFAWLREAGNVAAQEMYRVFNCGIGMVVIVSAADADRATQSLTAAGETVYRIGRIERCGEGEAQTVVR